MKKRTIVLKRMLVVALLLLCLAFAGCGGAKEDALDQQMQAMMDSVISGDELSAYNQMYPGLLSVEDFRGGFSQVVSYWQGDETYSYQRTKLNVTSGNGKTVKEGQYTITSGEYTYIAFVTYVKDKNDAGITNFQIVDSKEYAEQAQTPTATGTLLTLGDNSLLQWVFLLFSGLCLAFVIVSIVDVCRKKPILYGWWIVIVLAGAYATYKISGTSTNISGMVGILCDSRLLLYSDGGMSVQVGLPVGAIVYWCLRGTLLRKKQKRTLLREQARQMAAANPEPAPQNMPEMQTFQPADGRPTVQPDTIALTQQETVADAAAEGVESDPQAQHSEP